MSKAIDTSQFEMVMPRARGGGRDNGGSFKSKQTPAMRLGLHIGGSEGNKARTQFSVGLNEKLMELARFVAGDKVNLSFSLDRAYIAIERHPQGQWTLSPIAASKEQRANAVGKPSISAIKFTSPAWALGNKKLEDGFKVLEADIDVTGSKIVAAINLV